jgi:hypothetical protein
MTKLAYALECEREAEKKGKKMFAMGRIGIEYNTYKRILAGQPVALSTIKKAAKFLTIPTAQAVKLVGEEQE